MTRIVFSASVADSPWTMVSAFNREKGPQQTVRCYVRRRADRTIWRARGNAQPTTSAAMCASFHARYGAPSILFHCHLTLAVLWDGLFPDAALISEPARSLAFGTALADLLRTKSVVLRRGEGIWVTGADGAGLADRLEAAQLEAYRLIRREGPNRVDA